MQVYLLFSHYWGKISAIYNLKEKLNLAYVAKGLSLCQLTAEGSMEVEEHGGAELVISQRKEAKGKATEPERKA